ncbi:hypothetical protein ColKHC_11880 [Colletotrichum higginsianum]|nr:hypothetical protein ColKHC_11880 [Colletotrichum higginsianum]
MTEPEHGVLRVERHVLPRILDGLLRTGQVERQLALRGGDAEHNIQEGLAAAAEAAEHGGSSFDHLGNGGRAVEDHVDDGGHGRVDGGLAGLLLGGVLERSGVVRGLEAAGTGLVGRLEAQEGVVGLLGRRDDGEVARLEQGGVEALDVELGLGTDVLQREDLVPVGEQRVGSALGVVAEAGEVVVADDAGGGLRVDEGVVEEAEEELLAQEAPDGDVEPLLRHVALLDELDDELDALLAAELVDAGVEDAGGALELRQALDPPRAGGHVLAADHRVRDQAPVGDDDALEAELLPQEAGDDLLVEGEADGVVLGADGARVVRHHLPRAGRDRRLEGDEVVVEVVAGIRLVLAVGEVGVLAVLHRTAAGEVLGDGRHAVGAQLFTLEALDVLDEELAGEVGVLAPGVAQAGPPRLGGEVDLRVQRGPDADGDVLLAGDLGELPDQVRVPQGGEAEGLGPLGEDAGAEAGADVLGEAVAGVRRQGDGDAEAGVEGALLDEVDELGDLPRVDDVADEVEVRHVLLADHVVGAVAPGRRVAGVEGAVGPLLQLRLEELAGLFLDGHAAEEVLDPVVDAVGRVLVDGQGLVPASQGREVREG